MAKKITNRPLPFYSNNIRNVIDGGGGSATDKDFDSLSKISSIGSTSSFRYDAPGSGVKSSQQLNIDYSEFKNFTFFSSAQVNVNVAFDRIINEYPFDGTEDELSKFIDSLTGFENYVLGRFPKNKGFLHFSGTAVGEDPSSGFDAGLGTHLQVVDSAGNLFPELSTNKTGESVLNPVNSSFSTEMQLYLAPESNDNQVVFQKLNPDASSGFSMFVSESASVSTGDLYFAVSSGSQVLSASLTVEKGAFNHICAVLNRTNAASSLEIYNNNVLEATSSNSINIQDFNLGFSSFLIGSGTTHSSVAPGSLSFIPQQTLSGAIDEFRFFHSQRGISEQRENGTRNIWQSPDLKLYFKFNEPTGSYTSNNIALDSSGNSLHTAVTSFTSSLREAQGLTNPMVAERLSSNPVLFPTFEDISTLNVDLLTSASVYDDRNPNLITRLVPSHYFLEGKEFEGFETEQGPITNDFTGTSIPGSGKLGTAQTLSSFLYTWAKFFDDMKMMADSFADLMAVDYQKYDNVPDQFLTFLASHYGIELPGLFKNASFNQFFNGDDLTTTVGSEAASLKYIQNEIWRRILVNINDIIRSKGTLYSVKSLIRSVGIDPDNNFRIREFGGPTKAALEVSRQFKSEVSTMLDFSGSLADVTPTLSYQGIPDNKPFVMSSYLSGSRTEVGWPDAAGAFVDKENYPIHGISNDDNDGLFTSGSFTYEGIYKFPVLLSGSYPASQSLVRLHTTGSSAPALDGRHGVLMNLVAISGSNPQLKLLVRSTNDVSVTTGPHLELALTGANIFDGNKWNVSVGRYRADDPSLIAPYGSSEVSSSFFLRCSRQNFGKMAENFTTSSFYNETIGGAIAPFSEISAAYNPSGSFFVIGSQSLNETFPYLNNASLPSITKTTDFAGSVTQARFWSKALSLTEWREHVVNFKSLGVEDPLTNFNFVTQESGSFQRLRVDTSTDQQVTESNAVGNIEIFDFTQQLTPTGAAGGPWRSSGAAPGTFPYILSGSGFEPSKMVIKPEQFYYSMISPRFAEAATDEKIRPRSFQDSSYLEDYEYAQVAPVYEILRSEIPTDDARFSIEFSIIDALNEDIIKIFGTLSELNDGLGNPNLLFSPDYPNLEDLRDVYFNRLTDKINLKGFFEFFKWFDTSVGQIIEQLVPRKTDYLGTNFVIESHMLERAKLEYHSTDMYMGEDNRSGLKGTILLQQFVGDVRRF